MFSAPLPGRNRHRRRGRIADLAMDDAPAVPSGISPRTARGGARAAVSRARQATFTGRPPALPPPAAAARTRAGGADAPGGRARRRRVDVGTARRMVAPGRQRLHPHGAAGCEPPRTDATQQRPVRPDHRSGPRLLRRQRHRLAHTAAGRGQAVQRFAGCDRRTGRRRPGRRCRCARGAAAAAVKPWMRRAGIVTAATALLVVVSTSVATAAERSPALAAGGGGGLLGPISKIKSSEG